MIITRTGKGAPITHNEMDNNLLELRDHPNGIVSSEDAGKGIKLNPGAPVFGWHDLIGIPQYDPQAATPEFVPCVGGIRFAQYDVNEEGYICFHIPHDYVPGSKLYIHCHWLHNSTHVTGGSVDWGFELTYAKGYEQEAFTDTVTFNVTAPASTVKNMHVITENEMTTLGGSATTVDTARIEVDGLVFCRVYLNSNDITTDDSSAVKPFLISTDIHYQSTGITTIDKNFPFYTP